jgi:hypothetical protein
MNIKQILLLLSLAFALTSCKTAKVQEEPVITQLSANPSGSGPEIHFEFRKGASHNHPSFVLWVEDTDGNFIQTLFISKAVGTSIYDHGDPSSGQWEPAEIRRPASLPYWSHRRGIQAPDGLFIPSLENPVADAYTGATPDGDFDVKTRFDGPAPKKMKIFFEVNQTWDWNEYWTNDKYPDDDEYKTSCQPALVYMCEVDLDNPQPSYEMRAIGHSHYAGRNGDLFTDLSTITTALEIAGSLKIRFI